jgi:hypothetical protein
MGRMRKLMVVAMVVTSLGVRAVPAHADGYADDAGMGFAAVGIDILYIPAKVVYATLGGITGGFAYILTAGNFDTATSIWKPSLGGTYVVTPSMVAGDDPIYFSGGQKEEETVVADTRTHESERSRARVTEDADERPTKQHARGEAY